MAELNNSNSSSGVEDSDSVKAPLERDFYGCYCLKFRIKHGASVTEEQIFRDFGAHGEVLDVWGAGFVYKEASAVKYSDRLDSEVNVRFPRRRDAKEALKYLREFYHELTPAISDVLPDNHGVFTISFENKMAIPTSDLHHEFSKYGEIKSITGALNIKMGKIFISYWRKESAIQAFLNKTERWFMNMRFTFPRCEKDYFGTYCMKFYNTQGTPNYASEMEVREDFGRYGEVVDIRGPGLYDVAGDDVYVRYWEKTSAQTALSSLVGRYDCLCITPASGIQPDKYGLFTLTFVNKPIVTEDQAWQIFQQFGRVVSLTGTFCAPTGRLFVSYEEKEPALRALQAMLITKQFKLQLAKSCKPLKFAKSVKNYYSAATLWSTTEFPRKRKVREEDPAVEQSKWRREEERCGKVGDWFLRREESLKSKGLSKHYSVGSKNYSVGSKNYSVGSKNQRKPLEEKKENIDTEAGASYSYRAPYQDDGEGVKDNKDETCTNGLENLDGKIPVS